MRNPNKVGGALSLSFHVNFDSLIKICSNKTQVYSLIGGFCGSPVNFHAKDGSGYEFLGEIVLQLDKINPQVNVKHLILLSSGSHAKIFEELIANNVVFWWMSNQVASRMVSAFSRWRRYDKTRQALAKVTYFRLMKSL